MSSKRDQPSLFQSLLDKRKQVDSEPIDAAIVEPIVEVNTTSIAPDLEAERRKPGRPRGRRSNPDYTQISAYIPLDLLLDIQEELSKEKRRLRKRSAMTVSELAENLLRDWLKQQKTE